MQPIVLTASVCSHVSVPTGWRGRALVAPALERPIGAYTAGHARAGRDLDERALGRHDAALDVVAPARDRSIHPQPAGVREARGDAGVLALRYRRLADRVAAPAQDLVVSPQAAGVRP